MKMKKFLIYFLLSSFLITNLVLAQQINLPNVTLPGVPSNISDALNSILVTYGGLIFIIIFVIILLIIAGVIHMPSLGGGGIPWGLLVFLILIVLAFTLPQFVTFPNYVTTVPPEYQTIPLPAGSDTALQMIGLPTSWAYVPAIIYMFVLPFAAIYTLVWAFLISISIFPQKNINRILALIITFLTIPTGWFVNVVWILFSFIGVWAVAVFAVTFILGIFFKGAGVAGKEYVAYKNIADTRKSRLKTAIKDLDALKHADLGTIRQKVPAILEGYADVLPANVASLAGRATQQEDVGNAQAMLEQAVNQGKKAAG